MTTFITLNFKRYKELLLVHRFKILAFATYFFIWLGILFNRHTSSPELTNWMGLHDLQSLYYSLSDLLSYYPNNYFKRYTFFFVLAFLVLFHRKFSERIKISSQLLLMACSLNAIVTYFVMPITTYRFISIYFPILILLILEIAKQWKFRYILLVGALYCFSFQRPTNFLPLNYEAFAKTIQLVLHSSEDTLCILPRAPFNPINFYSSVDLCKHTVNFDQKVNLEEFSSIVLLETHNFHDGVLGATIPPQLLDDFYPVINEKPLYILKRKVNKFK
ncbi:hypothetical protein [Halobacteriovorax sp. HLS]|uniref:hypothetical protein n=1 Tax=Halobacteriovorax sp. HLS TaxID=2234000 RepID=UPI000FDAF4EB|nr:hypothetical protein [Halobacteriovorax sp. HLS]